MAAGKLFISKKSYKTYKNTDETPEFMPSNFFFPKAIQVFPRLILVPRHYIVPIYIYYDNLFTYQAQCSSVTQMWQLRNPCECNIPKKSS